jgi:hypothetical protein
MKLASSARILEKFSNIKFHENPSSGSRVVPCGQTDRHDEANSRFSQFCESVKKCDHATFKNNQLMWGICYLSKHFSYVKLSHLLVFPVKLILFLGCSLFTKLEPFYAVVTLLFGRWVPVSSCRQETNQFGVNLCYTITGFPYSLPVLWNFSLVQRVLPKHWFSSTRLHGIRNKGKSHLYWLFFLKEKIVLLLYAIKGKKAKGCVYYYYYYYYYYLSAGYLQLHTWNNPSF